MRPGGRRASWLVAGWTRESVAKNLEPDQVGRDRDFRDTFDRLGVAHAARTAHVAEERLHRVNRPLHVDEDRAIGAIRDRADHAVPVRRLRDPRAVVHALDTAAGDAVPVHDRAHGKRMTSVQFCISPARKGNRHHAGVTRKLI
jgi:hypothetical protein